MKAPRPYLSAALLVVVRTALLLVVVGLLFPPPLAAQEAPVQSDLTPGVDILHVRARLLLLPQQRMLTGSVVYHVMVPSGQEFKLRADAVDVRNVQVFSDSTEWSVSGDTLLIALPDSAHGEQLIRVDYATARTGYDIRGRAGWQAAWTPSRADESHWLLAPVEWSDAFSVDVRLTVPPGWDVFWPDGPNMVILGPESAEYIWQPEGTRLAHAVGFLASEAGFMEVVGETVRTVRLPDGYPTQIWNGLHLVSDNAELEETPLLAELAARTRTFRAAFGNLQTNVFPTDSWLAAAIPVFAAARSIRDDLGEGAYGSIMETARMRYLAEARRYQRPLIWDSWWVPSDLDDAHATWKGLWVLHMLARKTSAEVVLAAARSLDDMAATAPVDSESFRRLLATDTAFFDRWVYGAGHPVITLVYSHRPDASELVVIVRQEQEGPLVPDMFPFSTNVTVSTLSGLQRYDVVLDARETRFRYNAPLRPRYVHFDDGADWLFEFSSTPDLDDVTLQLRDAGTDAGRIRSLSILKEGGAEPELIIGLRPALTGVGPYVMQAALPVLAAMAPSPSALRLIQEQAGARHVDVRQAWLKALTAFPGPEAAEQALKTANSSQDGFLLQEAVRILVERRPEMSWSVLQSALVTDSESDRIRRQAITLVETSGRGARERVAALLPLTENPHHPVTRGEALMAAARIEPGNATVRRRTAAWLPDERPALRAAAIAVLPLLPPNAVSRAAIEDALAAETRPALRRALLSML